MSFMAFRMRRSHHEENDDCAVDKMVLCCVFCTFLFYFALATHSSLPLNAENFYFLNSFPILSVTMNTHTHTLTPHNDNDNRHDVESNTLGEIYKSFQKPFCFSLWVREREWVEST